jgi:RNA polymerase sigma-70 factor, ECF subfamily
MRSDTGDLVRSARGGDAAAFEQLVRLHLRAAYGVAFAVTNDPNDAEDVTQDAFITALERLEECKDPHRFSGWLLRIVRNRALNLRRSQSVRAAKPLAEAVDAPSLSNPERDAGRTMLREELSAAMNELTETQRQVVVLHDLEGYRHREIGELLGISEGASRFHLSTARGLLRGLLTNRQNGETSI